MLDQLEWLPQREESRQICQRFGNPRVDLFVPDQNQQIQDFIARTRVPQAVEVDGPYC